MPARRERRAHYHVGMSNPPVLARRPFGPSGDMLSIVGFGGIILWGMEQTKANRLIGEVVERGVNYFDIAPTYGDAEVQMGPALAPYRKNVFLACKTTKRDAAGARAELAQSLARLHTDYLDLYQLHAITDVARDVDAVFAPGGAMEAYIEAKRAGVVRHLGFSAHSVEAAMAAMDRYEFDSILFPVNFATFHEGNFGPQVMALAQSRGVSRLAIKPLASTKWNPDDPMKKEYPLCWYKPLTDPAEAELALTWTLSQDITAAIPPGHEGLFRMCLDFATRFKPMTPAQDREAQTMAHRFKPIFEKTT